MKEIQELISRFIEDRPVMKKENAKKERQEKLLRDEVDEAMEVIDNPELLGRELADIIFFCVTIAYLNGIDLDEEVKSKIVRNYVKYPSKDLQEGEYTEIMPKLKNAWRDEEWYKD